MWLLPQVPLFGGLPGHRGPPIQGSAQPPLVAPLPRSPGMLLGPPLVGGGGGGGEGAVGLVAASAASVGNNPPPHSSSALNGEASVQQPHRGSLGQPDLSSEHGGRGHLGKKEMLLLLACLRILLHIVENMSAQSCEYCCAWL